MPAKYAVAVAVIVAIVGHAWAQQTQPPANPPTHCEEIAISAVEKANQILSRADNKYAYPLAVAYNNACVELREAFEITTGLYHCDAEITVPLGEWVTKMKDSMNRYNQQAGTAFNCRNRH